MPMQRTITKLVLACLLSAAFLTRVAAVGRDANVPSSFDRPAASSCRVSLLQRLGWRIESTAADTLRVATGPACDRDSLATMQRLHDLRLYLPEDASAAELLSGEFENLIAHPASHCAWSSLLGDATRAAVGQLVANPELRFSALQTGWIAFGLGGPERDGWRRTRSFGRGYVPLQSPSAAIQGLYRGSVRAECGAGRQFAQLASLHELFGARGFDAAFTRDELMIGTFNQLNDSDSILLGARAGEFVRDGRAEAAAAQGRQAFMGLPGFIVHVFERRFLDDVNNQAENFVIHDVSAAAADALRHAGGFEPFNRQAHRLWELRQGTQITARRVFQRLLHERDGALFAAMPAPDQAALREMRELLDGDFFRGVQVYVHPHAVRPLSFHFARLLDRNPRTPFRIELALSNLHTTIYRRWIEQQLEACEAGAGESAFENVEWPNRGSRTAQRTPR